jgi:hypothetical protein
MVNVASLPDSASSIGQDTGELQDDELASVTGGSTVGALSNDGRVCRVRAQHVVERVRSGVARAKATGTRSGKALGRPRTAPEVEQRIRDALATPGRPGFHKIAAQFGVATGTVQRIAQG